jgi:hypothetical protein
VGVGHGDTGGSVVPDPADGAPPDDEDEQPATSATRATAAAAALARDMPDSMAGTCRRAPKEIAGRATRGAFFDDQVGLT